MSLEERYDDLMQFLLIKKHQSPALFINKLREIKGAQATFKTLKGDAGSIEAETSYDEFTFEGGANISTTVQEVAGVKKVTIDSAATLTEITSITSPALLDLILDAGSGEIDMSGDLIKNVGNVDGVDVSAIALDNMPTTPTGDVGFNAQNITGVGNVDGIDISAISLNSMPSACGGDVNINNHGINNIDNLDERVYYVATDAELDNAISDITTNACAGRIIITDSLSNVQATINAVNSSFIIEGNGDKIVLDANGDNTVFTIINCLSCVLRDFKINATDLTSPTKKIIDVTEANNNKITIDNITVVGDGSNGYGIDINSANCVIKNCNVSNVYLGIGIRSSNSIVIGNYVYNSDRQGIFVYNVNNCIVTGNICRLNWDGITLAGSSNNTITGNICNDNEADSPNPHGGIRLDETCDQNTISGNTCNNNSNVGTGTGYGIYIANANDDDNTVMGNTALGNDTNYLDNGTNTFDSTTTDGDPLNNFVAGAG